MESALENFEESLDFLENSTKIYQIYLKNGEKTWTLHGNLDESLENTQENLGGCRMTSRRKIEK